jgi:parallel beta-helix repeat protein
MATHATISRYALKRLSIVFCILLTLGAVTGVQAQLSGSYTIGSGGTYASFTAACNALSSQGVSGPVTFNVITGTYNEQAVLRTVPGSSASNTITFQSQSGNAANVTLGFIPTSSNNYVFDIDSVNYVTIKNMTLVASGSSGNGTIFRIRGTASHITIQNNILNGNQPGSSNNNYTMVWIQQQPVSSITVTGNTFTNSGYGVYYYGNSSVRSTGTVITNNSFSNFYESIYLQYQDSPVVDGNTFTGVGYIGIECDNSINGVSIQKNSIVSPAGSYGIYTSSITGGTGFPDPAALIANNFISMASTSSPNGISLNYPANINIYANNINLTGATGGSAALTLYGGTASTVNIVDNIFSNPGGGYTYYLNSPATINTLDYNNLFTTGVFLVWWNGTVYPSFSAYQTAVGKDASSQNYNPMYTSATDLHVTSPWLNNKGTPLAEVATDYEGQARNGSTPDIGADEYTPAAGTTTPLSGTYTIGASGTYHTFQAAVTDLLLKGVSAPVIFNIQNGTYNEHFVITDVPGSSPSNTVTFQAQTGIVSGVTLYYPATVSDSNYVIKLLGARNIRLHKFTLRSNQTSGAQYGRIVYPAGGWDNLTIDSTVMIGVPQASSAASQSLFYAGDGAWSSSLTLTANNFSNGSFGIVVNGYDDNHRATNTVISSNIITTMYQGMYIRYQDSPVITNDSLSNLSYSGIELDHSGNGIQVTRNRMNLPAAAYGFYLSSISGGTGFPTPAALVANNFISMGSTSNPVGITINYSANLNIYANTFNMTGAASGSAALSLYAGTAASINVVDNIFSSPGGGYTLYVNTPATLNTVDYNDLYTTGPFITWWNGAVYSNFASYQTASGKDASSLNDNPLFPTATNYRTASPWLNNKGTPLAEVTDDIVGQARDGSTPDIGAYEFTPAGGSTTPLSGTYTIGASGNYTNFRAAVADLLLKGVSAPVTFNVQNGTYNEHVVITDIPGSSPTNTVTFQSLTNVASGVTLYYPATVTDSNYVIKLLGARNVKLHKFTLRSNQTSGATYARIVYATGGWDNLTIDSTVMIGAPQSGSSNGQSLVFAGDGSMSTSVVVNGNSFSNGSYAIVLNGFDDGHRATNTVVTGNTFSSLYQAIYVRYQDSPIVTGNIINTCSYAGIEVDNAGNGVLIAKNKLNLAAATYGIYLSTIVGGSGFPNPLALVSNNFITMGSASGITGISINYSANLDIYANSVNLTGAAGNSTGLYLYGGSTASVSIADNIFANPGGGYCTYVYSTGTIATMDYNDLYTTGQFIGLWGSTASPTLAGFRILSGKELASVNYNPMFASASDLHAASPWLNNKGTPLAEVTDDIDGNPRNGSTPDIGATEYTPDPSLTTPLSGTYTIGTSGNYTSFRSAVNDLLLKGISAPVTFNVANGTYTEHVIITDIPGSSPTNTVSFRSGSGNPAGPILYYPATVVDSNYVIKLIGAKNIHFSDMTLRSNQTSSAQYGCIIYATGGWDNLAFDSVSFIGVPLATSSASQSIIYAGDGAVTTFFRSHGSSYTNGSYGIFLSGYNTNLLSSNTEITANTFSKQYEAAYIRYQDAARVTGNTVSGATYTAFEINTCNNGLDVSKNRIAMSSGSYGLYFSSCVGGGGFPNPPALVANNMISIVGNMSGITYYYSSNFRFLYNSISLTGSGNGYCFSNYGGNSASFDLINNIFSNTGGGRAYYISSPASVDTSDNNDLYSTGSSLAYWNGEQATLAALRTASLKEVSSITANPGFFSATNLHTIAHAVDSMAVPVPEVSDDIDGKPRDPARPDLGAAEFSNVIAFSQSILTGWNMVSLPVTRTDRLKTSLYPDALSKAFAYGISGYAIKDTLENGTGYWLKFAGPESIPLVGSPLTRDSIPVRVGWNMIGSISYAIPRTAIIQNPISVITSHVFTYKTGSGYVQSDTINPGVSYWVKTASAGSLILDVNQTSAAPKILVAATAESVNPESMNEVNILPAGSGTQQTGVRLYFTSRELPGGALGQFELPPVPPSGITDVRFASGLSGGVIQANGKAGELAISVQDATGPMELRWTLREATGSYTLVERKNGSVVSERPVVSGSTTVINTQSGSTYSIRAAEVPSEFGLTQNWPNPFNPTTSISFAVGQTGSGNIPVTLRIYNVLGQEVAMLVDQPMAPGHYSVTWNAANQPSGVYFYTLQAGEFKATHRMVLMK